MGAQPLPSEYTLVLRALDELRAACETIEVSLEDVIEGGIRSGKHNFGWKAFESHDRSRPIETFIEHILPTKIDFEEYWLLPVFDDNEYVSWTFIFVPKDLTKIMEGIELVIAEVSKAV
jgi:hypothetical protein